MNLIDFMRLLRAQLDAEGCICDPSVWFEDDGIAVGHDAHCPLRNSVSTLLRLDELRKEAS
jgi:hypothetical protein